MRFLVLGGRHREDGVSYNKGEVVETGAQLVKLFGDKFRQLDVAALDPEALPEAGGGVSPTPPLSKPVAARARAPRDTRGDEVTKDFTLARDEGFLVFKRGQYFHVYEPNENTPLNGKGLRKGRVKKFIQTHLEE